MRFNCVWLITASNLCKARVSKKIGQHDAGKFTFSFIFKTSMLASHDQHNLSPAHMNIHRVIVAKGYSPPTALIVTRGHDMTRDHTAMNEDDVCDSRESSNPSVFFYW